MPIINILTFSLKDKGEKNKASIVDIVKAIIDGTRGLVKGETKKLTFKRLPLKIRSFGISQM
ncbi:MAG TPA: hypothetical protein VE548_14000 [Nitrososphaeraceae archaeon]|nr:hypothetical protein [Nitrososphaeraceae archaeon]